MEQTQKKPQKRLSKKEKAFAQEYAKTGNGVQSALKVYDTESYKTASTIADANLDKPRVQNLIMSIAESIPDEDLIRVHKEGLSAVSGTGDNVQIDFSVRHKYLDTAYKLKGLYKAEDETPKGENKNIYNFFFNKEVQSEVKNLEDRIKLALIQKRNDKEN